MMLPRDLTSSEILTAIRHAAAAASYDWEKLPSEMQHAFIAGAAVWAARGETSRLPAATPAFRAEHLATAFERAAWACVEARSSAARAEPSRAEPSPDDIIDQLVWGLSAAAVAGGCAAFPGTHGGTNYNDVAPVADNILAALRLRFPRQLPAAPGWGAVPAEPAGPPPTYEVAPGADGLTVPCATCGAPVAVFCAQPLDVVEPAPHPTRVYLAGLLASAQAKATASVGASP